MEKVWHILIVVTGGGGKEDMLASFLYLFGITLHALVSRQTHPSVRDVVEKKQSKR